ncbi:hypothetical protein C8F04DRAFT_1256924 [Mycena alexandri]|uniref:Uncharacterized protein n=1 Tax=Mycena alexandri TaxID=1745969 RepID=A0AAD6T0E2_9AGAR|nr:hypothetical protein C8F04DRAFT_1256924 [Mycena alexandri]
MATFRVHQPQYLPTPKEFRFRQSAYSVPPPQPQPTTPDPDYGYEYIAQLSAPFILFARPPFPRSLHFTPETDLRPERLNRDRERKDRERRDRERKREEKERRKRARRVRQIQLLQLLQAPPQGLLLTLLSSVLFVLLAVLALELVGWFTFIGLLVTVYNGLPATRYLAWNPRHDTHRPGHLALLPFKGNLSMRARGARPSG